MLGFEKYEKLKSEKGFLKDGRGYHIVYCDGASFGNNHRGTRYAGCGSYWGTARSTSSQSQSRDTDQNSNQTQECRAILLALRYAARVDEKTGKERFMHVQVRSDSMHAVNSLNIYIKKWLTNNWRTCEDKEVTHRRYFEEIHNLREIMNVEIVHIRRCSDPGSIEADFLAKKAAETHQDIVVKKQEREKYYEDDDVEDEGEYDDEDDYNSEYDDNESYNDNGESDYDNGDGYYDDGEYGDDDNGY